MFQSEKFPETQAWVAKIEKNEHKLDAKAKEAFAELKHAIRILNASDPKNKKGTRDYTAKYNEWLFDEILLDFEARANKAWDQLNGDEQDAKVFEKIKVIKKDPRYDEKFSRAAWVASFRDPYDPNDKASPYSNADRDWSYANRMIPVLSKILRNELTRMGLIKKKE
jgi:hypothetical protein